MKNPIISRLLNVIGVIALIAGYIGQAFGHAFLLDWVLGYPVQSTGESWYWTFFTAYICPIGWWLDIGIIAFVKWVVTGNKSLLDWKIIAEKDTIKTDNSGALSFPEKEEESESTKA